MAEKKGIAERTRDTIQESFRYWEPRHNALTELERFVAGERYEERNDQFNRDRRLVQIRGSELWDTIRHMAARATQRPRSATARSRNERIDPLLSEAVTALVEEDLGDPWKGFEEKYEGAIISARQMRLGIVWMDWVADYGEHGAVFYRYGDPRKYLWDPSYEDPHDPLCPWLLEIKRMPVDKARKDYKAPWLQADREAVTREGKYRLGIPIIRSATGERLPKGGTVKDDNVTLWMMWYKCDPDYKKSKNTDTSLDPGDRYMACMDCGYRSETQQQLTDSGDIAQYDDPSTPAVELPEQIPGGTQMPDGSMSGCPDCGGDLHRIDKLDDEGPEDEKRLVILAPFCASPGDKPVFDGDWPIPSARSFPALFITANNEPGECLPHCDTDDLWDQQLAADQLRTLAVQRVFEHRSYWLMDEVGLNDYRREPFMFRDDQYNVILRDRSMSEFGVPSLEHIDGTGLDPSFMVAFNIIQDTFRYRGMYDQGPLEDRGQNQSGVALQTQAAIGEVPTEHFIRRKNRALSKFYGVVSDYLLATLTPEKVQRLNIDGLDMLLSMHGADLPSFDFVVEESPEFTGLEKARADTTNALFGVVAQAIQMGVDPAGAVEVFAELNHLPSTAVKKWQQLFAEAQARQEEERQAAMNNAMPPQGSGVNPMLNQPTGINGAGMQPAPLQ